MKSLATCLLALVLPIVAQATDYRYREIYYPGSANTALYAINDLRHYVGAEKAQDGAHHAIIGHGATLQHIDPDGLIGQAKESWAFSINARGDIAGVYVDATDVTHGYLRHAGGRVEEIAYPGGFDTEAFGVNNFGVVIGLYTDAEGNAHAFKRTDGVYENIDVAGGLVTVPLSINDWGQVAGEYVKTPDTAGFGYIQYPGGRTTFHTAPGSAPEQSYFISINNRRDVLGTYTDEAGATHNFIRQGGAYVPFTIPDSFGAAFFSAQTINNRQDVVGYYVDAANVAHGFVARAD